MFKLKLDEKGIPQVSPEGHALYTDLDTKEDVAFDVNELREKIVELGRENKKRRETNKTLSEKLKIVDGIDDLPGFVNQAKEVMDGGKKGQDEVSLLRKQWADEKSSLEKALQMKDLMIQKQLVETQFGTSPHFTGSTPKTLLSPSVGYKLFGDRFKIDNEDGKVIAVDSRGEPIYSKKNPEALASFDEALDMFLQDPMYKDLVKFSGAPGSGSVGGKTSTAVDGKTSLQAQAFQLARQSGDCLDVIKSKMG